MINRHQNNYNFNNFNLNIYYKQSMINNYYQLNAIQQNCNIQLGK